jgi:hypothetical protein
MVKLTKSFGMTNGPGGREIQQYLKKRQQNEDTTIIPVSLIPIFPTLEESSMAVRRDAVCI